MARATKVVCPHCHTSLKSARGLQVGQKISCPKCAASFTVPADEDRSSAAEQQGRVHAGRLSLVLFGALLYLLGGGALTYYCFDRSFRKPSSTLVQPGVTADTPDDGETEPSAPPQPAQAPTVAVDAAEQRKIDDAIVKGVWYLKGKQLDNGNWVGDTNLPVGHAALVGLTLLECGLPGSDPVVQKAASWVRKEAPKVGRTYTTYQWALVILFLDRLGEPRDEGLIQNLALGLIAGQNAAEGAWDYACPALDRKKTPQLLKSLADKKGSLADWQKTATGSVTGGGWDNSNTQFAILGLWVAQRHRVAIDKSIALVEKHFRQTQRPSGPDATGNNLNLDGSWFYDGGRNFHGWPSMTCAGLLALAMAHGLNADVKKKDKPLDDPAVRRALAMLSREIDRSGEQRSADLYFLWSLERVGVLYHLPKIEHKDWYAWGRGVVLPRQQADGSWKDGGYVNNRPIPDTCFALLFLKQANLAKDLTSKLQLLAEKK